MNTDQFKIGAKVEHPQFGVGIITKVNLTTYTIFFLNRGDKDISVSFQGLNLLEPSNLDEQQVGVAGSGISLQDLEKVFSNVLKRYA
ncbi:MAG: hypothetical protein ACOCUQ_03380, partial [Bacteroidota bacterium]